MFCTAFEIMYGGARGGGKSEWGRAKLIAGNPRLKSNNPIFYSYLGHPRFRALVLRRNATDLKEWIDRASSFYAPFGVKVTDNPAVFEFPTGPKIYTNHLEDSSAFEKYKGWELHRILVEELTLIEDESLYLKLLGSLRTTIPDLRPQILSTTNPDGPGSPWVKKRFVKLTAGGKPIPPGTVVKDPITDLTRVFIPAKLSDNPSLLHDKHYHSVLMAQDEPTRRAWLDGDWDALAGAYFKDFRPNGPLIGEVEQTPWARHVISEASVELKPYWHRWIGMDWGYDHASVVYWACNHPEGRVHLYREMVRHGVGSFEIGVDLAKASRKDLMGLPDGKLTLYLSPDAYSHKDSTKTPAQLLAQGIECVLGPGSAFLHEMDDDERELRKTDPSRARELFEARQHHSSARKAAINIVMANNDRVGGWNYMRELMRFRPILPGGANFDAEVAKSIFGTQGHLAYETYLANTRKAMEGKAEILPRLQIWDCCSLLIDGIQAAVRSDKKPEDILKTDNDTDDAIDAARYTLNALKDMQGSVPKSYFVQDRIEIARVNGGLLGSDGMTDMTLLSQVARGAEDAWGDQNKSTGGMRLRRACMPN